MRESKIALIVGVLLFQITPYACLFLQAFGTGWSYPNIGPDRWSTITLQTLLSSHGGWGPGGLLDAAWTSATLGLVVGTLSTALGVIAAKLELIRHSQFLAWVIFLPIALSPILLGSCFYDLATRFGIAGTYFSVAAGQTFSATSFAVIFFSQSRSHRVRRKEQLVRELGGSELQVWRHATLPPMRGLIAVCWLQTAMFAWLDYGYAASLGSGNVRSITLALFSFVKEGSSNYASLACLLILTPSVLSAVACGFILTGVFAKPSNSNV